MSNRYWVGGSGNWEDTASWSTTSGGSPGASFPTYLDDVFIDENSGFDGDGTISLEGGYADCKTLTCTSGDNYTLSYGDLAVHGSIDLEAGVTFDDNEYSYFSMGMYEDSEIYNESILQDWSSGSPLPTGWSAWRGETEGISVSGGALQLTTSDSAGKQDRGVYTEGINLGLGIDYDLLIFRIYDVDTSTGYANVEVIFEDNGYPDTISLNIGVNVDTVTAGTNMGEGWNTVGYTSITTEEYFAIAIADYGVEGKEVYFMAGNSPTNFNEPFATLEDASAITDQSSVLISHWIWDEGYAGTAKFDDLIYKYWTENLGGSYTFTQNGATIPTYVWFEMIGEVTFQDDLDMYRIETYGGTYRFNDKNMTVEEGFYAAGSTLYMGSGTFTVTGEYGSWVVGSGSTLSCGTSKIVLSGEGVSFYGGGKTYNWLYVTDGALYADIYDNNTFNKITKEAPTGENWGGLYFESGSTQTIKGWDVTGVVDNEITISTNSKNIFQIYKQTGDGLMSMYSGGTTAYSQSFTAPSFDGVFRGCTAYLKKVGSPTGTVYLKIYAHSGTFGTSSVPTGSALVTITKDASTVSSSGGYYGFYFNTPLYEFSADTNYTFVIEYSGGNSSNCIQVATNESGAEFSGNLAAYSGSWTAYSTDNLSGVWVTGIWNHTLYRPYQRSVSDYLDIAYSNATGANWYAGSNSIDKGTNTGWIFEDAPEAAVYYWDGNGWEQVNNLTVYTS